MTGVKQAVPYRTGREAWYLPVSTDQNQIKKEEEGPLRPKDTDLGSLK